MEFAGRDEGMSDKLYLESNRTGSWVLLGYLVLGAFLIIAIVVNSECWKAGNCINVSEETVLTSGIDYDFTYESKIGDLKDVYFDCLSEWDQKMPGVDMNQACAFEVYKKERGVTKE